MMVIFSLLTPFANIRQENDFDFHQDTSQRRRWHFKKNQNIRPDKMSIKEWAACSADLNPIENVLGILARQVYYNGKQYLTVKESKEAIIEAWKILRKEYLEQLVALTASRCIDIIEKNGQRTS